MRRTTLVSMLLIYATSLQSIPAWYLAARFSFGDSESPE